MTARRLLLCTAVVVLSAPLAARSQTASGEPPTTALVSRTLAVEARHARDTQHPMRYTLHKSSPRFSSTKDIFETKDGAVARLIAINDRPLNDVDKQKEQDRLAALIADPGRQRHRKQAEDDDLARILKVLRALPHAFKYRYIGSGIGPSGKVEKFTFEPDPSFDPPDLETEVLTAMAGEIWIDASQERVARLEGHLQHDVDFGWGILGRLNKNGSIVIEQSEVADHQWRVVRFQMNMSGRIVVKARTFQTVEEQTKFVPVPAGLGYAQAIQILRSASPRVDEAGR